MLALARNWAMILGEQGMYPLNVKYQFKLQCQVTWTHITDVNVKVWVITLHVLSRLFWALGNISIKACSRNINPVKIILKLF